MPVYEYKCARGHVSDHFSSVDQRNDARICRCGAFSHKVILTPPRIFGDYEGYESPATGRWIEGKRAREEDLRVSGCEPYEPGTRARIERNRRDAEARFDASVDDAVEKTLNEITL